MNENGTTTGNGSDASKWPGTSEACERLNVSDSTLRRRVKDGKLHPISLAGTWRFDPAELDRAATVDGAARDEPTFADLFAVSVRMVTAAEAHNEQLVRLYAEPTRQAHETLGKLAAAILTRVGELETKNMAMLEAAERSLSLQHERELDRLAYQSEERRRSSIFERKTKALDMGLDLLMRTLPAAVMKKLGINVVTGTVAPATGTAAGATTPTGAATTTEDPHARPMSEAEVKDSFMILLNLVESLEPSKVDSLVGAGVMTKEQASAVERLRAGDVDALPELLEPMDETKLTGLASAGAITALQAYAIRRMRPPATSSSKPDVENPS